MTWPKYLVVGSVAVACTLALAGCGSGGSTSSAPVTRNSNAKNVTLTITSNSIAGGKNAAGAQWITDYVIPGFEAAEKAKGVTAKVTFQPNGVDDAAYKTKVSLDLSTGRGADIVAVDGIWIGEFADAGYIKPLNDLVGKASVQKWDGWKQIKPAVRQITTYKNQIYGIPDGTDGRVIYFNKKLFAQAGLPSDWQPKSWKDILTTAAKLKSLPGVTPLQINAGTAMGEATTMQGFLPLLQGTGKPLYKNGKWQGDSPEVRDVLGLYSNIYGSAKLGDPLLQEDAKGRDKSFQEFSQNKLGILIESDYLWRSVINPNAGIDPMSDRDSAVGWAKIPAMAPGKGVGGSDFVSMSGGSGEVINPKTKYPQQAWDLMKFMNSAAATKARIGNNAQISPRDDVNAQVLGSDPLLKFISTQVLPITAYRPSLPDYTQISAAIQTATGKVVSGTSVTDAANEYEKTLEGIVGGSNKIYK